MAGAGEIEGQSAGLSLVARDSPRGGRAVDLHAGDPGGHHDGEGKGGVDA